MTETSDTRPTRQTRSQESARQYTTPADDELYEERAAIREYDAKLSRIDAEILARHDLADANLGVFFLACRKATTVLGVSNHMAVARSLQMLVADGVLAEVSKGGPHSNRASRYEWRGRT